MSFLKTKSLKVENGIKRGKVPKAELDMNSQSIKLHVHPEAYGFMSESVYPYVVPYNSDNKEPQPHAWVEWNVTKEDLILMRDTIDKALEWL